MPYSSAELSVGYREDNAMQRSKRILTSAAIVMLSAAIAGTVAVAADSSASQPPVNGTWEHHHASFTYYGITTLYSCDGLETNIRALLLHFGARKDATVSARGCPHGTSVPGHNAIVELDFYSLSPSSTDAKGGDVVPARWVPVLVSPTHPYFMGHGDCELVDELKDILSKNFSLRELSYRTDCVPHQLNIDDFGIKTEALKPLSAAPASAARG
jgi:hypothetical protein